MPDFRQELEETHKRLLSTETPQGLGAGPTFRQQLESAHAQKLQEEAQAPSRSALGEIGTGLKRGAMGELPQMVGQAVQWGSDAGSKVNEWGKSVAENREAYLNRPENKLYPDKHNAVTNALASGAEMLAPSLAPAAAIGAGLALAPAGAVSGAAGLGIAALGGAVPMGMSQAQSTYENVKEAGGTEEEATAAGWKSGAIETGGEAVGTYLGGKLLGIGAKVLGKTGKEGMEAALKTATDTALLKPFAKQLGTTAVGEVGTEIGQSYSQALVEKNAGVNVDPLEQAKAVIGPTLGMTALLAPFGLAGHFRNTKRAEAIDNTLSDPTAPPEQRAAVVDMLHKEAVANKIPDADIWKAGAVQDIQNGVPIRRDTAPPPSGPIGKALQATRTTPALGARQSSQSPESLRNTAAGTGVATSLNDIEGAVAQRESERYNQFRNTEQQRRDFTGTAGPITSEVTPYDTYEPDLPGEAEKRASDSLMNQFADDAVSLGQSEEQRGIRNRIALPAGQGFELVDDREAMRRLGRQYGVPVNQIKLLPNGQGFELLTPEEARERRGDNLMDAWADDAVSNQQREDQKRNKLALPPAQGFELLSQEEADRRGNKKSTERNQATLAENTTGPVSAAESARAFEENPPTEKMQQVEDYQAKKEVLESAFADKLPDFTKTSGKSFASEKALRASAKQRGIDISAHKIVKGEDGYIAVHTPIQPEQQQPESTPPRTTDTQGAINEQTNQEQTVQVAADDSGRGVPAVDANGRNGEPVVVVPSNGPDGDAQLRASEAGGISREPQLLRESQPDDRGELQPVGVDKQQLDGATRQTVTTSAQVDADTDITAGDVAPDLVPPSASTSTPARATQGGTSTSNISTLEEEATKGKIRERLESGKNATIAVDRDGSGVVTVRAGYGGITDFIQLDLTPAEKKAAIKAENDLELADTPEERAEIKATRDAALREAVNRAVSPAAQEVTESVTSGAQSTPQPSSEKTAPKFTRSGESRTVYGTQYQVPIKEVASDKFIADKILPTAKEAIGVHISKQRMAIGKMRGEGQGTLIGEVGAAELPDTSDFVIAARKPKGFKGHVISTVKDTDVASNEIDLQPPISDYSNRTIVFVEDSGNVFSASLGNRSGAGGMAALSQLRKIGKSDLTHGSKLDLTGIKEVYVFDLDRVHGSSLDIFRHIQEKTAPVQQSPPFKEAEQAAGVNTGDNPSRFELGKSLSKEEKKKVLATLTDVYKENNLDKEERIDGRGESYFVYPYSPEYFRKSDITGAMIRYYVILPGDKIAHPTELFPEYTQSKIDTALAEQRYAEEQEVLRKKGIIARLDKWAEADLNKARSNEWQANKAAHDNFPDDKRVTFFSEKEGKWFVTFNQDVADGYSQILADRGYRQVEKFANSAGINEKAIWSVKSYAPDNAKRINERINNPSVIPQAGNNGGDGGGVIPDFAKRAGVKTWKQADKKGLRGLIGKAKGYADRIVKHDITRTRGNPDSVADRIAEQLIQRTAITGGLDTSLRSLAIEYYQKANSNGADPSGDQHYNAIARGIDKLRDDLNGVKLSKSGKLSLASIESKWEDKFSTLFISERANGDIVVASIIAKEKKQGAGTGLMNDLAAYADQEGKRIVLSPGLKDDRHGTTSRGRLVSFYKRFGFVENKGRNKDFTVSEGMIRNPANSTKKSYAGVTATTADKSKLTSAIERLNNGEEAQAVREETGWFISKDGHWRFEIEDGNAEFLPVTNLERRTIEHQTFREGKLSDVFVHPELFKAYPGLADLEVVMYPFYNSEAKGQYSSPSEYFNLPANITMWDIKGQELTPDQEDTLLHEVQHYIQEVEGFARGADPKYIKDSDKPISKKWKLWFEKQDIIKEAAAIHESPEYTKELNESNRLFKAEYEERFDALDTLPNDEYKIESDKLFAEFKEVSKQRFPNMAKFDELADKAGIFNEPSKVLSAHETYLLFHGEIEARDTAARRKMTAAERMSSTPFASQGIPVEDMIVSFERKGKAASTGTPTPLTPSQQATISALEQSGKLRLVSADEGMRVLRENGGTVSDGGKKTQGFVVGDTSYIIPENVTGNLWGVVLHELGIHTGKALQTSSGFKRLLASLESRMNEQSKTGDAIRAGMERVPSDTKPEHYWEEVLAYMQEIAPQTGIVRQFIALIKNALVKLGLDPKIFTAADLSALAESALRKEGRSGKAGVNSFAQDAKMSLSSAMRKIQNMAAFRAWFANSKVVDENGEPLVVYHGSHFDISSFKRTRGAHFGFHFGDQEAANNRLVDTSEGRVDLEERERLDRIAERKFEEWKKYSDELRSRKRDIPDEVLLKALESGEDLGPIFDEYEYKPTTDEQKRLDELQEAYDRAKVPIFPLGVGSRIGAYYLAIKKPLRLRDVGNWGSTKKIKEVLPFESDARTLRELEEDIKAHGYDGIVYSNIVESRVMHTDSYIAFEPTQIKSIFNQSWNPANPDILASFAGPRATSADTSALSRAKAMQQSGDTRRAIWKQTGWYEIVPGSGTWSYELDDSLSSVKKKDGPLSEILSHRTIFRDYPQLADINVRYEEMGMNSRGSYDSATKTIRVNDRLGDVGRRSVIQHEVQHIIQVEEGTPSGANFNYYKSKISIDNDFRAKILGILKKQHPDIAKILTEWDRGGRGDEYYEDQLSKTKIGREVLDLKKSIKDDQVVYDEAYNQYASTTGEAESRLVQARLDMTPAQRKAIPPWVTLRRMLEREGLLKDGQKVEDVLVSVGTNQANDSIKENYGRPNIGRVLENARGDGSEATTGSMRVMAIEPKTKGGDNTGNLQPNNFSAAERSATGLGEESGGSGIKFSVASAPPNSEEAYAQNRAYSVNRKAEAIRSVKSVGRQVVAGVDKFLGSISTRLGNINPKLRAKVRELDFAIGTGHSKDVKAVQGLLNKAKKMSRGDFADWDLARKNSDVDKINALVAKYHMEKEYAAYRETLKRIREESIAVGRDVGFIEDYSPRIIKDSRGFLEAIGKGPERANISEALKKRAKELGITVSDMTPEMQADIVANLILGGGTGLYAPSNTKERKIKSIPPELNRYYMGSDAALVSYLHSMRKDIEARKFFGRMPEYVSDAKKALHQAQAKLREIQTSENPDEQRMQDTRDNIDSYQAKLDRYKTQSDYNDNIATYIIDLLKSGEIDGSQEQEVTNILKARFHESGTRGLIQAYKNLSYIDTMGSFTSAITQIGDFAWTAYAYGLPAAIKHAYKSVTKQSRITKEDVGIERIAQEFADTDTLSNAVAKVFKAVGLEKMDAIGKESLLNAALEKYEKRSVSEPDKLRAEIDHIFEEETDSVIIDLQNKAITDNVKLLVYSRLLDFQPAALSEMSEQYLKAGNGRLFYMLKSYTLKQFDVYRNEAYNKIKTGERNQVIEGVRNLAYLSMMLVLANAGADELKDLMLGRETSLEDRTVDNVLRLFGVSKFVTWKARTEGVGSAIAKQILPPFKFIDSAGRDIMSAGDGKGLKSLDSIPIVGKLAYWHMGRGAKSNEELWNGRLAKERSKLKDIKERVEADRTLLPKYRADLVRLKRIDRLQGQLNKRRKIVNRLKNLEKTTGRDYSKRIEDIEKRRTAMIQSFLERA